MEYAFRGSDDKPFGWVAALQSALARKPAPRREPLRLPAPQPRPAR